METELQMLALSVILGLVQLILAVQFAIQQRGLKWALSPRDESVPALKGIAARLDRAFYNFIETFPLFIAAVMLATTLNHHDNLTVWGAELYFWARVVYVPVYAAGIQILRTLVWGASVAGIILILLAVL